MRLKALRPARSKGVTWVVKMFQLPGEWQSFLIRDPAGNSVLSGSGKRIVDLSAVPEGRYSLTSSDGTQRYLLIVDDRFPGGALSVEIIDGNAVNFRFGDQTDGGPFRVTLLAADGSAKQTFYTYGQSGQLNLGGEGTYQIEVAKPGEAGFRFSVTVGAAGDIAKVDGIGVADRADWFVDHISFAQKVADRGFGIGSANFAFEAPASNPSHDFFILQIRDKQTGTVSTYVSEQGGQTAPLDPGQFEWRVFSLPQPTSVYPALLQGLAEIQGGWTPYIQRSADSPLPFRLPEGWQEFVLADPAGNTVSTGAGSPLAFFDAVPDGRYTLTKDGSGTVYHVVLDSKIEGRVFASRIQDGNTLTFQFADQSGSGPYYVSLLNRSGQAVQAFYIYGQSGEIALAGAGDWTLSVAQPGDGGFSVKVGTGTGGVIHSIEDIGIATSATWFSNVIDLANKTTRFTHNTGAAEFGFAAPEAAPESTYFVVQLRDKQTGTVSTWFSATGSLSTALDPGRFEWRAFSLPQPIQLSAASVAGFNAIEGGWSDFVQRPPDSEPDEAIALPNGWTEYVLRDPSGAIVSAAANEKWIDLTGVADGRYTLTGKLASGERVVRSVLLYPSLSGDALSIEGLGNGNTRFILEAGPGQPFYVQLLNGSGEVLSAGYQYGGDFTLSLPEGASSVRIARPSENATELAFEVTGGKPTSINGVSTLSAAEWNTSEIELAPVLAPVTMNHGITAFSYFSNVNERFLVQLRDPATGNINTYFSDDEVFRLNLGPGLFEWRAIALPNDALDDPDLIARATKLVSGGWTPFEQTLSAPTADYVLGLEPDKIVRSGQLQLTYPTDAVKLADGSIVVSNTYKSTIERIYQDGRVERLAGGNREGFVAEGYGADVLLRGPGQLFDTGDGRILFADTRNFVLREINLATGYVRVLYGDPTETYPNIPSRDLVGVGDLYDMGFDGNGQLYLSTAGSRLQGDQIVSDGMSYILRQRPDGSWYAWEFDRTGILDEAKFVDVLFHDSKVSVIVHNGVSEKLLRQYDLQGNLLDSVTLGPKFGGGLVVDPLTGDLLVGDHTDLKRYNQSTRELTTEPFPEILANISYMSLRGKTLVITDSDRGKVFEYDLVSKQIIARYGAEEAVSAVVTYLEPTANGLLMLDNQTPRILSLSDNAIRVVAGTGDQAVAVPGRKARESSLYFPNAVAAQADGTIFFVDANHRIMKIGRDGTIERYAGTTEPGYSGDGGNRLDARFLSIYGIEATTNGSLLVADSYNNAIRMIAPDGTVSTIAGNGKAGISNDAADAQGALNNPNRVLATADGRILIADSWNNRVVELLPNGSLVTIAGIGSEQNYQGLGGFSGDGGLATNAELNTPVGLAHYAADGTLFIADSFNNRIRFVDAAGDIHTLVGGARGFESGQLLNLPLDVTLVGDDLFVADTGNALVLKLTGVDRTGNDFEGALRLSTAMQQGGFTQRSEFADSLDPDFYDLANMPGQAVWIRADAGGLRVRRYDAVGNLLGEEVLSTGNSVIVETRAAAFLAVDGIDSTKRGYHLSVGGAPSSSASQTALGAGNEVEFLALLAATRDPGAGEGQGSSGHLAQGADSPRLAAGAPSAFGSDGDLAKVALMRQSLASFGVSGTMLDNLERRIEQHLPDFFA